MVYADLDRPARDQMDIRAFVNLSGPMDPVAALLEEITPERRLVIYDRITRV